MKWLCFNFMHFLMWVKISFDLYGSNWRKLNALINVKFIYIYTHIYICVCVYIYIFKSRDITLTTKVHLVKAMVSPVVMYGCDSWTVKKAECQRIDAFELWCWRRLLRVPWTGRRSNQSILKELSPGCSLEGLMLKLKVQYFGHLMWRTEKDPNAGKDWGAGGEGDDRGWDGWMALLTRWTWVWVDSRSW